MEEIRPDATMKTEITVRKDHVPFLRAAFAHAGWDVSAETEGVTTDDGYDHEVRLRVAMTVPLEALADAPALPSATATDADPLETLLEQLRLLA